MKISIARLSKGQNILYLVKLTAVRWALKMLINVCFNVRNMRSTMTQRLHLHETTEDDCPHDESVF